MPKSKTKKSKNLFANRAKLKFDKTLVLVIAAVVTITGGYLFYRSSHASTNYWAGMLSYYSCPNYLGIPAQLQKGSSNTNCIKALQAALSIDQTPIPINGSFDAATELSVVVFKQKNNLPNDSIVGSGLWQILANTYNFRIIDAKPLGTYPYNYGGMRHNTGVETNDLLILDGNYGNFNIWQWYSENTDHADFLQYGPYVPALIQPGQHGLLVCQDFASFNLNPNKRAGVINVYTDLSYNNGNGTVTGPSYTFGVAFEQGSRKPGSPSLLPYFPITSHCQAYPLPPGSYKGVEFRMKGLNATNPVSYLDLRRTRASVY